jgi:ribosome-associated protein
VTENAGQLTAEDLKTLACDALDDLKGKEIVALDVRGLTSVTDWMVFCTGTSNRHVKSLADNVEEEAKKQGVRAIGVEGKQMSDWVLVDFGDVVVHVMAPEARAFYDLERLWTTPAAGAAPAGSKPVTRPGNAV